MLTIDQRDQTIEALEGALKKAEELGAFPGDGGILMVVTQDEARGMIETLRYPFPSPEVTITAAEQQTPRERQLYDWAKRNASSTTGVKIHPSDLLYLSERNNFLRDSLGAVGEQVSDIADRVDRLYGQQVSEAAAAQDIEDAFEASDPIDVFEDVLTGARIAGASLAAIVNLLVREPRVTVTPECETAPSDLIAAGVREILKVHEEFGDAVKSAKFYVAPDGKLTLDINVEVD